MKILSGKSEKPRRILLYGVHGVGKSTWAAEAPGPIFLDVEDGIGDIDVAKTERLKDYGSVVSSVSWLVSNPHEFKTVIIDTADWLEHLIFDDVARAEGKTNIEAIGYGKGYKIAAKKWQFLLQGLEALREKGMTIVILCHAQVKKFTPPDGDGYERYEPALHEVGSRILQEWCDEVLFACFRIFTRTEDQGFGKERKIAVGGKDRLIKTSESASVIAKNRLRLPEELPMSWSALAEFLPGKSHGNVSGLVVNGSSKTGVLNNG